MGLKQIAKSVRKRIFEFKTKSGKGHLASCLSTVDILVSMYYDGETSFNHNEDIVIYSKGHGSPTVYPILVDKGYIKEEELEKLLGGGNWKTEKVSYETDQGFPTNHSATPNTTTARTEYGDASD